MSDLKTRRRLVASIIDELGGTCQVADLVGVVPSAVSNWRRCGKFPSRTYVQLSRRMKLKGIPIVDYLWSMNARA